MMVGVNISDEQLGSIADRTIQEADQDGDSAISFTEFVKVSQSPLGLKKSEEVGKFCCIGGREKNIQIRTWDSISCFDLHNHNWIWGFSPPAGFGEGGCRTENEHPISSLKD